MHPPLNKPHPLCDGLVKDLQFCHVDNPYMKFVGTCNKYKIAMDDCFREEKKRNRDDNRRNNSEAADFDKNWAAEIQRNPDLQRLVNKIENKQKQT